MIRRLMGWLGYEKRPDHMHMFRIDEPLAKNGAAAMWTVRCEHCARIEAFVETP